MIYGIALVAYLVSASPLAGPKDLVPATLGQFAVRTSMGAIVACALLAPLVLDRPDTPHRILGSRTMVTLGRWSYGLFIWHLAALVMVFPMIGKFMFNGDLIVVFVLTTVLGFAMAAVSYALIESPCRNALRRWEYRRAQRTGPGRKSVPVPPLDSSVTDTPEPAVARGR
jgi:peptidoglycan/LPS O-acetylase OafA/YrhL